MAPSTLRRLALAGMAALLVGAAACAQTPEHPQAGPASAEPANDSIEPVRTRANAGDAQAQFDLD